MNILFIGMKHCGKTTHGKKLAKIWNCPFYDTDDLIMKNHYKQTNENITIREFYKKYGADAFQKIEATTFINLINRLPKAKKHIISAGGRLPQNPELQNILKKLNLIIFLKLPIEILSTRIMAKGPVPFLNSNNPKKQLQELYQQREPYYTKHAHITINLTNQPIKQTFTTIKNKIEEYINVR